LSHCVLMHGPCRGRLCDFWARVRIRKNSIEDLTQDALQHIRECDEGKGDIARNALGEYWEAFGIKNRERLCKEEPDLCEKIILVEQQVLSHLI
jgi:hypothetical protein